MKGVFDERDPNKQEKDAAHLRLIRKLSKELLIQRKEVIREFKDDERLKRADYHDIWTKAEGRMFEVLSPELNSMAELAAFKEIAAVLMEGIDMAEVNADTIAWAELHTANLVKGITQTTRQAVANSVIEFTTTEGSTMEDLISSIRHLFSPERAERIAVTEVTRAFAKGAKIVADRIESSGIPMMTIWNTNNDGLVCPMCRPLNQKQEGDGWTELPPRHPFCRCWLSNRIDI